MVDAMDINKTVLLLQSGGRDSAIAAISLLKQGFDVVAVTFCANAMQSTQKPRERALEISEKHPNYSWSMVEFGKWEQQLKNEVSEKINGDLPRSCILCALSKITAAIHICNATSLNKMAMGYVDYQNDWAEQTPYAIELQQIELKKHGLNLILPAINTASKSDAIKILSASGLTSGSLENPCCISKTGTQPVPNELIKQSIDLSFLYIKKNKPTLEIADHVGDKIICL